MKIGAFKFFDATDLGLSVMNRYIISELILPFLFGMGIFTSLGLSIGAVFELVRKVTESGLPIGIAIEILILKMPEFIVLAFPMSILLATLMAYSRLSSDSELIALRSIGISVYRLIVPAIAFSLLIVGITFIFNNFIAPAANHQAKITLNQALNQTKPSFKERNIIYPEYQNILDADGEKKNIMTRLFYAEEFDGTRMKNLTILDRSQKQANQIITASSAEWNMAENVWDFYDGTIYLIGADSSYRNVIHFQHQQLALPKTAFDLAKKNRKADEMNIFEAIEYLKIIELGSDEKEIRKLKVRIQEKIALPFVCLVFALIGAAIGAKPQNSGKATGFGICIGLIFSYYLMTFIFSSLGIGGIISPFMAAWLPNFVGFGLAGLLLKGVTD